MTEEQKSTYVTIRLLNIIREDLAYVKATNRVLIELVAQQSGSPLATISEHIQSRAANVLSQNEQTYQALLKTLAKDPGRLITPEELLREIEGNDEVDDPS